MVTTAKVGGLIFAILGFLANLVIALVAWFGLALAEALEVDDEGLGMRGTIAFVMALVGFAGGVLSFPKALIGGILMAIAALFTFFMVDFPFGGIVFLIGAACALGAYYLESKNKAAT